MFQNNKLELKIFQKNYPSNNFLMGKIQNTKNRRE